MDVLETVFSVLLYKQHGIFDVYIWQACFQLLIPRNRRVFIETDSSAVMYLPEDAGRPLLEAFKENETIQKFDASGIFTSAHGFPALKGI